MADISLIEKTNENAILFRSTKKATEFLKVACSEMQGEGMDLRSQTTQKQDISCLILDWQPADVSNHFWNGSRTNLAGDCRELCLGKDDY